MKYAVMPYAVVCTLIWVFVSGYSIASTKTSPKSSPKSSANAACTLFFEQNCLPEDLIKQANGLDQGLKPITQSLAANIALELQISKQANSRSWPYPYERKTKKPLVTLFQTTLLKPIWIQALQFASQKEKNSTKKFNAKTCMNSVPTKNQNTLVQLSLCSAPRFNIPIEALMQHDRVKILDEEVKLQFLLFNYEQHIEQAQLRQAEQIANIIILQSSTMSPATQARARIQMIEAKIGFGFSEVGARDVAQFTTHVDNIVQVLGQLDLYKKWAVFLATARHTPILKATQNQKHKEHALQPLDGLLLSPEHQDFLAAVNDRPILEKLSFFQHNIQAFFYSFLHASPSHDAVLAYHSQRWIETWNEVKNRKDKDKYMAEIFDEGLKMIYLEMRVNSYMTHRKKSLENQQEF